MFPLQDLTGVGTGATGTEATGLGAVVLIALATAASTIA